MPIEPGYYDENTLYKVKKVLEKYCKEQNLKQNVIDCVSEMQNEGIYFRELPPN